MRLLLTPFRRLPDALRYPLITVGMIVALELFDQVVGGLRNPVAIYLLVNVMVAFLGGMRAGLISAALIFAHALYFFATPGQPFLYSDVRLGQLGALLVAAPGTALLAGVLQRRTQEQLRQLHASEGQIHLVLDNTADGIVTFDAQGIILSCNPAAETIFGYPAAEVVGRHIEQLLPAAFPAAPEGAGAGPGAAGAGGQEAQREVTGRRQDGSAVPLALTTGMMRQEGRVVQIGILHNITARKQAEVAMQESERRFHALFDSALDAMLIFNDMGRYLDANPAACALFGESRDELLGRSMGGALVLGAEEDFRQTWRRFLTAGFLHGEFQIRRADGAMREVEFNARARFQPGCHLAVIRDITEYKQSAAALRASEERFATVFRAGPVAVSITSLAERRFLDVNAGFLQLSGYTREELIGRSARDLGLWDEQPNIEQGLREHEPLRNLEGQIRLKSGEVRHTLFSLEVVDLGGDLCILGSSYDITDRKRAEKALRESEKRFSLIFQASPEIITLSTLVEGRFVDANESFLRFSGYTREEVLDHTTHELRLWPEPNGRAEIGAHLRAGRTMRGLEIPLRTKSGEVRDLLASFELVELGGVTCLLSMGNDITERKRAEAAQARFAAILEATSDFVGMVDAHGDQPYLNRAGRQLLGYREDEDLADLTITSFYPDAAHDQILHTVLPTALRTGIWRGETVLLNRDGREIPVSQVVMAHENATGELEFISTVARDISEHLEVKQALQQANTKLENWIGELEQRNRESALLNEMGDLLQTCRTIEEAYEVMAHAAQRLFPTDSGAFALIGNSRNLAETAVVWGEAPPREHVFGPDECWALRRGRAHRVEDPRHGLICPHIHGPLTTGALCVPMVAQGETLGVLHLRVALPPPGQSADITLALLEAKQRLAVTVAEHTALALANLRLRESLRSQAIRDPLTGLFNRRYMEESLEREIRRAERNNVPLGIIMLDLDHFKHFNDTFGHAAGDTLLRELGGFLRAHIREADIACRYGGEEFILVFPDATREDVRWRAEQLREAVKHLDVQHRGQPLGGVTLSLGVAVFPEHGMTAEDLLFTADNALYIAKGDGRDRVVVALRREPPRLSSIAQSA